MDYPFVFLNQIFCICRSLPFLLVSDFNFVSIATIIFAFVVLIFLFFAMFLFCRIIPLNPALEMLVVIMKSMKDIWYYYLASGKKYETANKKTNKKNKKLKINLNNDKYSY